MKNNKYRKILYLKYPDPDVSKNAVPLSNRGCSSDKSKEGSLRDSHLIRDNKYIYTELHTSVTYCTKQLKQDSLS